MKDFDRQQQKNAAVAADLVPSGSKRPRTTEGDSSTALRPDPLRPLSIGLIAGEAPAGCGWGSESEEESDVVVVLQTPETRELREKELQKEASIALKKWRKYVQQLDWAPFVLPAGVVCPAVVSKPPATIVVGLPAHVTIIDAPVPAVHKKVYDLMDDLGSRCLEGVQADIVRGGDSSEGWRQGSIWLPA